MNQNQADQGTTTSHSETSLVRRSDDEMADFSYIPSGSDSFPFLLCCSSSLKLSLHLLVAPWIKEKESRTRRKDIIKISSGSCHSK